MMEKQYTNYNSQIKSPGAFYFNLFLKCMHDSSRCRYLVEKQKKDAHFQFS